MDRPVAVVDAVNTGSPTLWYVHVDHLNRPIRMTDGTKASVWNAVWTVWGAPHAITGAAALSARFPGQWFQVESGLHYNWHRHYDPSLGRYTQPDPLGFVDGPSVFAYAKNSPGMMVDPDGRQSMTVWNQPGTAGALGLGGRLAVGACLAQPELCAAIVVGAYICYKASGIGEGEDDPREYALRRCLAAADSGDDTEWGNFCVGSRFYGKPDRTRSARCRGKYTKQMRRNFCYNEFGN